MTSTHALRRFVLTAVAAVAALGAALAQDRQTFTDPAETRRALADAQAQGAQAKARAEALEAQAAGAVVAAERTAQQSAALAARIQQAEAEIAASEARAGLIASQRAALRARLAEQQRPLIQLTAALQRLSRRPTALSLLRPGSLRDTVYLRAVLESMLPEVQRRTAGLRAELDRGRALQLAAQQQAANLRRSEAELAGRRRALAVLETQQRLASRAASGEANRETEHALALAEQARDLSALVDDLAKAGDLRDRLAALPGPIMRPPRPEQSLVMSDARPLADSGVSPGRYILPVAGRLVAGFGEGLPGQPRTRGIAIAARAGAQAVAPAGGRVAFAGPYEGFGSIVIIEHPGGWTTLVTGLAQLEARVGQELVIGSPLGTAGPGHPVLSVELRHEGNPVNPLDFLKG